VRGPLSSLVLHCQVARPRGVAYELRRETGHSTPERCSVLVVTTLRRWRVLMFYLLPFPWRLALELGAIQLRNLVCHGR
jgi:hypothetical protein